VPCALEPCLVKPRSGLRVPSFFSSSSSQVTRVSCSYMVTTVTRVGFLSSSVFILSVSRPHNSAPPFSGPWGLGRRITWRNFTPSVASIQYFRLSAVRVYIFFAANVFVILIADSLNLSTHRPAICCAWDARWDARWDWARHGEATAVT
jgi:hypothetical protein